MTWLTNNEIIFKMHSGYAYLFLAIFIWAFDSGVFVRYIDVPALTHYAIGSFWSLIFIFIALVLSKKIGGLNKINRKNLNLVLLVGLLIGLNNGLFFAGLKSGAIANAVLSHNLAPILVALVFAPIILKERVNFKTLLAVFVGFIGLSILTFPEFSSKKTFDIALIYGSLSAFFYAFGIVVEKKVAQTKINPFVAVFYKNLVPLIIFSPFAYSSLRNGIPTNYFFLLIFWGVIVLGLSFLFYFKGLEQVSATKVSLLSYGEPVGAILLAFLFFRQPITPYIVFGGFLILLSSFYVVKNEK